ncbi:hypothetical protein Lgee_2011 [Legionella geestiana]|uniref:Uncharacterized protein n=1 Tax=Legionella geestiana TaxID=45065 RepID=A0A0W0TP79_9GAMM|nr:CBU_0585 family protein [Legionella geestiana]KTC97350.1 hypothetical protein Lgee_2011 [Legionella geestiana]QBS12474.1 hypothetical protein E4T54_06770 [Legionella geestiana]QDQ39811.1 hypothetical protein E3226_005090 [Legionella geestiana]STX55082.1 Uncharacterised protein [Legionella geestiana]
MNQFDIDKAYISPDDAFLRKFDMTHPLSLSQEKEVRKHERIALLRDVPLPEGKENMLWDAF